MFLAFHASHLVLIRARVLSVSTVLLVLSPTGAPAVLTGRSLTMLDILMTANICGLDLHGPADLEVVKRAHGYN